MNLDCILLVYTAGPTIIKDDKLLLGEDFMVEKFN